jgi:hypothetical protein
MSDWYYDRDQSRGYWRDWDEDERDQPWRRNYGSQRRFDRGETDWRQRPYQGRGGYGDFGRGEYDRDYFDAGSGMNRPYGQRRNYGGSNYSGEPWEDRGQYERGRYGQGYGSYGQNYGYGGYGRPQPGYGPAYSYGNYGSPYQRYPGGYGRGGYNRQWDDDPAYGWQAYGGDSDYDYDSGDDYDQPALFTYTEYWWIPGPFTGIGPQGYQRSDERIMDEVCERLTRHGQIDASGMSVEVRDGEVTVRGEVENRRSKRMVEDTLDNIAGVKEIHNELRVRRGQRTEGERMPSGQQGDAHSMQPGASPAPGQRATAEQHNRERTGE